MLYAMKRGTGEVPKNRGMERLAAWMKAHGKRQEDIAEAIETIQQNVSRYLRGQIPPLEHAVKLETLTEIPVSEWAVPIGGESGARRGRKRHRKAA